MQTANTKFQSMNAKPHSVGAIGGYSTTSIDPVVSEVHAIRAQQWAKYGDDAQAWFADLLKHQDLRKQSTLI